MGFQEPGGEEAVRDGRQWFDHSLQTQGSRHRNVEGPLFSSCPPRRVG